MTEWLDNPVVGSAIYEMARNREVKWEITNKDTIFGIRHTRINWSKDTLRWLEILEANKRPVSIFIGTNVINWDAVDHLPPRLRGGESLNKKGREDYNKIWKQYTTPAGCATRGVDFYKIWLGKNMVWDIDHENDLSIAFGDAYAIYQHLKALNYTPSLVFSGNKGFHVWLSIKESEQIVGMSLQDVPPDDPLRHLGKLYREKIQEISVSATGSRLPNLDLAPAQRQGIIRCPYSQHGKTGLVVWPLDEKEIKLLKHKRGSLTPHQIADLLHSWDMKNWNGEKVSMPPHYTVINRGLGFELTT